MTNRKKVSEMFNNAGKDAYSIHLKLGIGIKEVYNYIRECEVAHNRHRQVIRKQRELDKASVWNEELEAKRNKNYLNVSL